VFEWHWHIGLTPELEDIINYLIELPVTSSDIFEDFAAFGIYMQILTYKMQRKLSHARLVNICNLVPIGISYNYQSINENPESRIQNPESKRHESENGEKTIMQ
jgi:hypothetical protein